MEAQPVNLKLCLYGGKEATIERSFNKSTTLDEIQQLMRNEFNVNPERETKLWINSSVYTFKPNQNSTAGATVISNNQNNDSLSSSLINSSDIKENNGCSTANVVPLSNSNKITTNGNSNAMSPNAVGSANAIPSPPPMPLYSHPHMQENSPLSSSSSHGNKSNQSSPNVITRQAAQTMNKQQQQQQQPIALPDSTTVLLFSSASASPPSSSNNKPSTPNSKSTTILSTSDSNNSNSPSSTAKTNKQDTKPTQTLSEAGVSDSAVVTLEVINNDGTWPSSKPRYGALTTRSSKAQPGLCGLSNMGNTCFMNAALQCLSNSPPLTNYILSDKFLADINTNNPLGMHGEIARTYAELIKVMWSGNNGSYMPREFKCAVSRFAPQFTGFAQQDCQELMAFLLDGLHEDLNRIKNKPYIEIKNDAERRPDEDVARESWEIYKKRNDSVVVDTFHAMLKSTLVCPECELVSVTFDPFCYLSLPLPVKREKQVNLTFLPAPARLDEKKIATALSVLDSEDVKIIMQYGGKISSFDGNIEENAGYTDSISRPKGCKMHVPRSGPASELCDIVARIINDERPTGAEKVNKDNLVVAELAIGRVSKIYSSSEHYNQISEDIVVIEKASKYVLPLYLKERKDVSSNPINYGMSKLLFLHVPELKYDTLYKSIIASLSNLTTDSKDDILTWHRLIPPTEPNTTLVTDTSNDAAAAATADDKMECDDGYAEGNESSGAVEVGGKAGDVESSQPSSDIKTNGKDSSVSKSTVVTDEIKSSSSVKKLKPAFDLATVNSFGNHSFEPLGPGCHECDDSSKLYLGATFSSDIASTPQFEHNRAPKSETVDTFTPKIAVKPTLQLKDCISQFTNAERLGADDPWYCPKCKKHQQAIKKFDIWSLPEVLIIHLKRFSFSRSWRDKIDTLVEFPVEDLDMSDYVHNPEQKNQKIPLSYNLIGVANHFGGLGGGHYTAFAKNGVQNAWYSFDDALVSPTSANNVVTRSAYCLFYLLDSSKSPQELKAIATSTPPAPSA